MFFLYIYIFKWSKFIEKKRKNAEKVNYTHVIYIPTEIIWLWLNSNNIKSIENLRILIRCSFSLLDDNSLFNICIYTWKYKNGRGCFHCFYFLSAMFSIESSLNWTALHTHWNHNASSWISVNCSTLEKKNSSLSQLRESIISGVRFKKVVCLLWILCRFDLLLALMPYIIFFPCLLLPKKTSI